MIQFAVYDDGSFQAATLRFRAGITALEASEKVASVLLGQVLTKTVLPILWNEEPVKTGRLRQQTSGHLEGGPEGAVVAFSSGAPYAGYVLSGTGPHTIRPTTARVLAFAVGGETVFAREVQHPGTKANDFVGRALHKAQPVIQAAMDAEIERIAEVFRRSL